MDAGSKSGTQYPFSFTGKGGEFFKIWIVNIILTILTLYIYSAWAKVRTKRYFYGNTVLDGSSFDYHAKPLQILWSRLVAVALLILVTLGGNLHPLFPVIATVLILLVVPWALWRSIKFNARMTSYRNVRFGFIGPLKSMYFYQFLLPFLPIILLGGAGFVLMYMSGGLLYKTEDSVSVLGGAMIGAGFLITVLMIPWIQKLMTEYYLRYHLYGKSQFDTQLSTGRFYSVFIIAFLLGILSLIIVGGVIAGLGFVTGSLSTEMLANLSSENSTEGMEWLVYAGIFAFYALMFTVGFFFTAYVRARLRMHVFSRTLLDKRVAFESTVTAKGLWWILFSNFLLTVFTLGFGIPFAQVRMARYLANNTVAYAEEPLDKFVGEKREEVGAFGDELGDAFDMDMDVGI